MSASAWPSATFLATAALILFPGQPALYAALVAVLYIVYRVEVVPQYDYIAQHLAGQFVWDAWHRPLVRIGLPLAAALASLVLSGAVARRLFSN